VELIFSEKNFSKHKFVFWKDIFQKLFLKNVS